MNRAFLAGALAILAASWGGMVLVPLQQLGQLEPIKMKPPLADYPPPRPGLAAQGFEVYRSLGCAACHTRQITGANADLVRGWGARRTVAQDYLQDRPVLLGTVRIGPDLANIGARALQSFAVPWKFRTATNAVAELERWHLMHLYDPRQLSPGSLMPAYRFLFREQPDRKSVV
jgi:cytochrome c oxidase cbb3-type subunit 2